MTRNKVMGALLATALIATSTGCSDSHPADSSPEPRALASAAGSPAVTDEPSDDYVIESPEDDAAASADLSTYAVWDTLEARGIDWIDNRYASYGYNIYCNKQTYNTHWWNCYLNGGGLLFTVHFTDPNATWSQAKMRLFNGATPTGIYTCKSSGTPVCW